MSPSFLKFTNLFGKCGISVNLRRRCEVGLLGPKAGVGINMFKEPVAHQVRETLTESQSKSYIASEIALLCTRLCRACANSPWRPPPSAVRAATCPCRGGFGLLRLRKHPTSPRLRRTGWLPHLRQGYGGRSLACFRKHGREIMAGI